MSPRLLLAFALFGLTADPVAALEINTGSVVMTTTAEPSSVTLHVTIHDEGQIPGCQWFAITRLGSPIAFFPRDVGNTITYDLVDTDVEAYGVYWYELVAWAFPFAYDHPSCDIYEFRNAFGSSWGAPIDVPALTGPGPTPFYHGRLVADESYPGAHLESCEFPFQWAFFNNLPAGFEQYLGSDVVVYGEYTGWDVQFGWSLYVTGIEPRPCAPLPVQESTWGRIKSMYR